MANRQVPKEETFERAHSFLEGKFKATSNFLDSISNQPEEQEDIHVEEEYNEGLVSLYDACYKIKRSLISKLSNEEAEEKLKESFIPLISALFM